MQLKHGSAMWNYAALTALLATQVLWAEPHLKSIKVAITNTTGENRPAEDIVLQVSELKKIAPDFYPGSQIVTASDASTIAEDATVLHPTELPSQVDDLDGDLKPDELAFQIDLNPHQTRIVTITWGALNRIFRLRGDYEKQTNAIFTKKIDGVGWESKRNAFRLYFDKRNAIDLFGKARPSLQLDRYARPGYVYHNYSPDGRDIYLVADALGIGAPAGWVNGTAVHVADVDDRDYRIVSTGPVRAIVELTYKGWRVAGKNIDLHDRITQWAGERGFLQTIESSNAGDLVFAAGLTQQQGIPELLSSASDDPAWLAMWGVNVTVPSNGVVIVMVSSVCAIAGKLSNCTLSAPNFSIICATRSSSCSLWSGHLFARLLRCGRVGTHAVERRGPAALPFAVQVPLAFPPFIFSPPSFMGHLLLPDSKAPFLDVPVNSYLADENFNAGQTKNVQIFLDSDKSPRLYSHVGAYGPKWTPSYAWKTKATTITVN